MEIFDLYARLYDLDYAGFDDDLFMYQQFAARCGAPILELGCGTGRLLLALASDGYEVTGVDVSAPMLELARRKVINQELEGCVTLLQRNMRELDLGGRFNLAFAAINSFMHMETADDQLATLSRIRERLNPGGLLILDLFNPDPGRLLDAQGQVVLDKVMTDPETGHQLIKFRSQKVDLAQQMLHMTLIIDDVDTEGNVRRYMYPFPLRYLFRGELELLLQQASYEVEALYGSYDLDEFRSDSDKMIVVARASS